MMMMIIIIIIIIMTTVTKITLKRPNICIAPLRENLTSEALRYGSHSFYPANTPYPPFAS